MNNKKILIQKITLLVMFAITILTTALAVTFIIKNNRTNQLLETFQNNSIVFTEEQYNSLNDDSKEFFILTINDYDNVFNLYIMKIDGFNLDIYTALILSGAFNQSDFDSLDGIHYFFKNAMTDVEELRNDENYYETSEYLGVTYTNLVIGLQNIIIDKNYTIIKSAWE